MTIKKPKNHIMLPASTLKRFTDSDGRLHYFDINNEKIARTYARSYYSRSSYYPEDVEQFLSQYIEKTIGDLNKAMNDFADGSNDYRHLKIEAFALLCAVQELRVPRKSKTLANRYCDHTDNLLRLKDLWSSQNSSIIETIIIERSKYWLEEIFHEYDVNICIVRDDTATSSFLLPSHHWYIVSDRVYFVVSPYRAVVLLPTKENKKFYASNTNLNYFECTQNELDCHISRVLTQEILLGERKVVGQIPQLEKLSTGFKEYLENELENFSYYEINVFRKLGADFNNFPR